MSKQQRRQQQKQHNDNEFEKLISVLTHFSLEIDEIVNKILKVSRVITKKKNNQLFYLLHQLFKILTKKNINLKLKEKSLIIYDIKKLLQNNNNIKHLSVNQQKLLSNNIVHIIEKIISLQVNIKRNNNDLMTLLIKLVEIINTLQDKKKHN